MLLAGRKRAMDHPAPPDARLEAGGTADDPAREALLEEAEAALRRLAPDLPATAAVLLRRLFADVPGQELAGIPSEVVAEAAASLSPPSGVSATGYVILLNAASYAAVIVSLSHGFGLWALEVRGQGEFIAPHREQPMGAVTPAPGQESVWDYPRPPRAEPDARRAVLRYGGVVVADTADLVRVLKAVVAVVT